MLGDLSIVHAFKEDHITETNVTDQRDDFARYLDDRGQLRETDTGRHECAQQGVARDPRW